MVVVSVMGILASLALPNFRIWIENSRIRTSAEAIQTGLQKARVEALKHNAPVQLVLGANSAWSVGCVTVTADCPAVIEARAVSDGSSASISVTATPAANTTVVFTSLGLVSAAPVPFTQVNIDSTQLSATDSRELRVTLSPGGASRMCDPYAGLTLTDPRRC